MLVRVKRLFPKYLKYKKTFQIDCSGNIFDESNVENTCCHGYHVYRKVIVVG